MSHPLLGLEKISPHPHSGLEKVPSDPLLGPPPHVTSSSRPTKDGRLAAWSGIPPEDDAEDDADEDGDGDEDDENIEEEEEAFDYWDIAKYFTFAFRLIVPSSFLGKPIYFNLFTSNLWKKCRSKQLDKF